MVRWQQVRERLGLCPNKTSTILLIGLANVLLPGSSSKDETFLKARIAFLAANKCLDGQ